MAFDIRGQVILQYFRDGMTFIEASECLGISIQAIYKRMWKSPEFAAAVVAARDAGRADRKRGIWYRHPFRGKRPPTGKGHGGEPRFTGKMRKMNRFRP